jgi:predicted lipoprotein with Yx(FWY)xxD motif
MKRLALVTIVAALAFSACGGDSDPSGTGTTPAPTLTSPSPEPTQQASGTVNVASSSLGSILVDGQGRTLYVFLKDTAGVSNCTDGCATTWPPLTATGSPTAGAGVDGSLLGTIQRTGGGTQVTYKQRPLYHFASDAAAGDTKGQGVGGNWFVVSPAGEPIQS